MLFAFGSNGSGQLSLGNDEDTHIPTQCLIPENFPTEPPKQIVAGWKPVRDGFESIRTMWDSHFSWCIVFQLPASSQPTK
jgi:hypothetical protein